jgi:hypothetical protein
MRCCAIMYTTNRRYNMYSQSAQTNVLKLFNALVVAPVTSVGNIDTSLVEKYGVVTDFAVDAKQKAALAAQFQPLPIRTLFGRLERSTASIFALITKQLLHYVEVYGLNRPGLFDLEVEEGKIVSIRYVRGISESQLGDQIRELLYTNAPVKDSALIKQIIVDFSVDYDINRVANNELRVALYDLTKHVFASGDDAVRYLVLNATGNTMLIKSKRVVDEVKAKHTVTSTFFEKHERALAQVFNRHKAIILAAKNRNNRTSINKITRLSKTQHVPVYESIGKRFVALALAGKADANALTKVSVRDKLKMLNLIEYKMMGHDTDAFIIRNGKVHLESGRAVKNTKSLESVRGMILFSLEQDLAPLAGKRILLDASVDYGLPVSRKQAIGNLPFGTCITVTGGRISSGIYWQDDWGARDLDLSTIDRSGQRTGWGSYSGYSKTNPVTFSGDMTSAHNGAMEFMTSSGVEYGLFVNIFSGNNGSKFELVVGRDGKDRWINDVVIREKSQLDSRGNVIGFVNDNKFVVYQGRLNDTRWSVDNKASAVVARGTSKFWTVSQLLDAVGIAYDLDRVDNVDYDHDMTYAGFSYDRLENLLLK